MGFFAKQSDFKLVTQNCNRGTKKTQTGAPMSFEVTPDCIAPPAAHWAQEFNTPGPLALWSAVRPANRRCSENLWWLMFDCLSLKASEMADTGATLAAQCSQWILRALVPLYIRAGHYSLRAK